MRLYQFMIGSIGKFLVQGVACIFTCVYIPLRTEESALLLDTEYSCNTRLQ